MKNSLTFKVLLLTTVILLTFAGLSRAITFSGTVMDSSKGISGATVGVENTSISTTTSTDGAFSLSGVPAATDIVLWVRKSGYQPVYTSTLNFAQDTVNPSSFVLLQGWQMQLIWRADPEKGAIMAQVMDLSTRTAVSGAVVTATSALRPTEPYTVTYLDGLELHGSATYEEGVAVVLNINDGCDTVTLHVTKPGWCFPDVHIPIHRGSVGETILLGGNGICYSGTVNNSSGTAVAGATVEMAGNPALSMSSNGSGVFTLPGLPSGTEFSLKATKTGYLSTYTSALNSTVNIAGSSPLVLFTAAELGVTSGKGAIIAKLTETANGSMVSGVVVTASSLLTPGKHYPVTYSDGTGATSSNGVAFVLNVDPGDTVTLHAVKTGWSFVDRSVPVQADSVSEARIPGTVHQRILSITVPGGGTGGGTITGNRMLDGSSVAISCNANCTVQCDNGTTVILHQDPAEYSLFTGWTGCDSADSDDCSVTMTGEKYVTAAFDFHTAHKVRRDSATQTFYHSTITDAYLNAGSGDTLRAWGIEFTENFSFNRDKAVVLRGGYDGNHEINSGYTILNGVFSILSGSFIAENLVIR